MLTRKVQKCWKNLNSVYRYEVLRLICKVSRSCKSAVGVDSSLLFPYSLWQFVPIIVQTALENDENLQRFNHKQNKKQAHKILPFFFQGGRHDYKIESFYTTRTRETTDSLVLIGFAHIATPCSKLRDLFFIILLVKKHSFL